MATPVIRQLILAGSRLRRPRRTVRFRLTVLYSSLFLVAGACLLAITYLLVDRSTATALFVSGKGGEEIAVNGSPAGPSHQSSPQLRNHSPTAHQVQIARQLSAQAAAQHAKDLYQLLTQSGIALAIMAALAIVCGWLMAGRVLRPLAQVENFGRRRGQATFFARCGNIARRAVSSISVLKVCLSFSASARTAAGRALISAR